MNFQIIFIASLIIIYGIFIYIKRILVPKIKGSIGENKVSQILKRLNKKEFRKHIKRIRKQTRGRRKKEKLKICPKCGGKLIIKKGQYGKFYGCSNFPICKYTLNADSV
jgi:hypothetical protein